MRRQFEFLIYTWWYWRKDKRVDRSDRKTRKKT